MADFSRCVSALNRAAGRELDADELQGMFERIQKTASDLKAGRLADAAGPQNLGSPEGLIRRAAELEAERMVAEAERKAVNAVNDAKTAATRQAEIGSMKAVGIGDVDAVKRLLVNEADGRTNQFSLESRAAGVSQLLKSKVQDTWAAMDRSFMEYLQRKDRMLLLLREIKGEDTGDALAKKGAKAWLDTAEQARQWFNEKGGKIGHLEDWGVPQHYSQELVAKAGKDANVAAQYKAQREAELRTAKQMTERAQDFYVSLGMPSLPQSYWEKTQFIKPDDRDVVCHASAWDMNMEGDVRTKMCIKPNEENFTTIYHELGHIYYDLAYNPLPPLFQGGANDGFHEAIGDTIVLAMTPKYLSSIGLVDAPTESREAVINNQMRMALSGVSFLPFGLMIDRWRWGVFDGSITADNYNKAWWDLKAKYQGVAPASTRGEEFFDPGAKYHVPGNTPYTRYFLARILQFQFYKGLCDASGYKGPLHECTFYGNKEAGQKYWAMLSKGASQPWQATLKELTGTDKLDAGPMIEYFSPVNEWLKQQNEGQMCGWQANAAPAAK